MSDVNMPEGNGTPVAPVAARPGRGLRIALAVSVALNLAVAGVVAGIALHGGPAGRGAMMRDMGFGPFEGALRPEDRDALRTALRGRLGEIRDGRRQMESDMEDILQALRASPFDAAALEAAMNSQAAHLSDRLSLGSELVRDHLLGLTDEERQKFADRMEDRMRHGPDERSETGEGKSD